MADHQIPEDLRKFILDYFPSVPHLEALLLLRSAPQEVWSPARIALRLYIGEPLATSVLKDLAEGGLIAYEPEAASYRYAPATPPHSEMVDRLADLYAHALIAVTNVIHGRSAQLFADAFRFRKD